MKKIAKIVGYILFSLVVIITVTVFYIRTFLPSVPVEDITVKATPARLERGKYLFTSVAACADCHSERDPALFSMPVKEGTEGSGGELFDQQKGFPGAYYAKNLTPYHLGNWTDGELFRAITSGVGKDGHALFPLMPYKEFGKADKEDIFSIMAYMRTLKPINKDWPASQSDFPMNIIIHTIPGKPDFQSLPEKKDAVKYGGYLVNMGSCMTCHTQADKGKPIAGLEFAGGRKFPLATGGIVSSANITPDTETGIGNWSRNAFVQRFRAYADSAYHPPAVASGSFNTWMPWTQFGKMTAEDLSAIYDYLRTMKPVKNRVNKFSNL